MAYPLRYPHENGSMWSSGCATLSGALKMAPSQTPWWLALSNAFTVAPGRCTPKGEYPLVFTPPPESDRKSTRLNSSHGYISYAVFCLKKKKKNCEHRVRPASQTRLDD